MLPLAPVAFSLTCPAVRPRGVGSVSAAQDETASLTRLEKQLERQRALIRKALAEVTPIGQKTVRGSLTSDMIHDHDETMASEGDDDQEGDDDNGEEDAELE